MNARWVGASGVALCMVATATAARAELPNTIVWTAYQINTAGYGQAVAVGSALKNNVGKTLRVLPGKNDLSRLAPVREGKADFSANGIGTYMSQEGAFEFAIPAWGPQKTRLLAINIGKNCMSVMIAGDLGVETPYDLKGRRAAIIKAAPGLNYNLYAYLRFGDLEWEDTQRIEFPSSAASTDSIVQGQADVAFTSTVSGSPLKLEASNRGITWPRLPHDDEAGWERMLAAAPYYVKHTCTEGVAIGEDKPLEGATYPYPVLMAYDDKDTDQVYAMTKTMQDLYEHYKDSAPGAGGWALENQQFEWVVPFHEGAIRYYQEVGVWTPEYQAHNDGLVERQDLLAAAWEEYSAAAQGKSEADFQKGWQSARVEALKAGGMPVVWPEW